jgi:citrate lyase subunit beta/citryl-CoA lyase
MADGLSDMVQAMTLPTTYLFVPGDRPERYAKAAGSGADRIILDLEDAVRPDAKAEARALILEATLDWSRIVVRINDAASPFFADDLAFLGRCKAGAIMVPKAEKVETLQRAKDHFGVAINVRAHLQNWNTAIPAGQCIKRRARWHGFDNDGFPA